MAVYLDRLYDWASSEVFPSNMLSGISSVPSATNRPSLRSMISEVVKKEKEKKTRTVQ